METNLNTSKALEVGETSDWKSANSFCPWQAAGWESPAAEDEANVEWGLEDEEDGGAEEIEVIGFDPDLVDVIGDAESDELGVDFDELDFFEPAVKGIGADVRFEGRGDRLPNFHNARVF